MKNVKINEENIIKNIENEGFFKKLISKKETDSG